MSGRARRTALSGIRGIVAAAAVILLASGCEILSPRVCTAEFVYGVEVEAVSAADGDPVTAGLSGRVVEGSYVETMERHENRLYGAGERPGTYVVTVDADGFEPWTQSGVRVEGGVCHVQRVRLTAELSPTP